MDSPEGKQEAALSTGVLLQLDLPTTLAKSGLLATPVGMNEYIIGESLEDTFFHLAEKDFPPNADAFLSLMMNNPFSSVIGAMGLFNLKSQYDTELVVIRDAELTRVGAFRMEKE